MGNPQVAQIRRKDDIPTTSYIPRRRATGNLLPFRDLSLHIAPRNSKNILRRTRSRLISELNVDLKTKRLVLRINIEVYTINVALLFIHRYSLK